MYVKEKIVGSAILIPSAPLQHVVHHAHCSDCSQRVDQTFTHFDRGNRIPLIKFPLSKFPFKTFDQIVDEQFDRVLNKEGGKGTPH
jgi:hypothetical protein